MFAEDPKKKAAGAAALNTHLIQQAEDLAVSKSADSLLSGGSLSGLVFTCKIGRLSEQTFQVTEFTLSEALSSLFTLSVSAVSLLPSIPFDDYLGSAASLMVTRDGVKVRTVQGLLASAEQGNTDGNKTWYHFIIRPEMWVMSLNQDSRIFQKQSVPDILATLLNEAHVKCDKKFYQDELHHKRDYITQKRESAYEFWCRLACEEGINFWFEEGPKLFYSDNHLGMTDGIDLTYNPQADTDISDSTVSSWRYTQTLCSDVFIQKDYNPDRPSYPFQHQVTGEGHKQHAVYESYGRYCDDETGKPFTQLRYEQSQNQRQTGSANTNCFALRPGKIFTLNNHPSAVMNQSWQVVSVSHRGVQPLADNGGGDGTQLSNTVRFIPGTQEWRPPFRFRPQANGDELATVVGPKGEEIYTNEQGAVKVYFHWDRYGQPNHSASCWVRVAMGWNGSGYGFMSIPRIGQEVIISYLNGDIDKPVITGCTYNGRNRPPLDLPKEKTRTTFRTQTHKGDGFNELRFDDLAGEEEIYLHAQKDMNMHVEHDATWHIQHDLKQRIDNNSHTELTGDEHVIIKGSQKHQTTGDVSLHIKGEQHTRVDKNLVTESGQQTHHLSDGKIIIEAGTEITLKVGDSFIRITAGAIFTSGNLNIGDSGPGVGAPVTLMSPEGVLPATACYPVKKYCAVAAQTAGSWIIKSGE